MDRCQIDALLSAGLNRAQIARRLGFKPSSIGREIKRNFSGKTYHAHQADLIARDRRRSCRKPYKIHPVLASNIQALLALGWSPEQISGRLWLEHKIDIHFMTIYRYLNKHQSLRGYLRRYQKRGAGRYLQRKTAQKKRSIDSRPKLAHHRKRLGDWERDLFFCANKRAVLILADRKSRLTCLKRVRSLGSESMAKETASLWQRVSIPPKTLTNDNGTEFAVPKVGSVKVYYCAPRRPDQRGTVENTIGLLRQYLPRKVDISGLTDQKLHHIENLINLRPRKCLKFRTPYEVFFKQKIALAM